MDVQFLSSLPHIVVGSMATVGRAPYFEGFDQWVYVTFAALPEDLRKDIQMIAGPIGTPLIFRQLLVESPRLDDLASLIEWITGLSDESITASVSAVLQSLAIKASTETGSSVPVPPKGNPEAFRDFLSNTQCEWTEMAFTDDVYFRQFVHVLANPSELKSKLVLTISQFWENHFKSIYPNCRQQAARSIKILRRLTFDRGFANAFASVAGRPAPAGIDTALSNLETLVFVPNCFTGPFVQFVHLDDSGESLALLYNCRGTGGEGHKAAVRQLFPPLRALADETRLDILAILADQELYAQQIVDQVEISQPAVSRHLGLMVASGILISRKTNGMKFYSVNVDSLAGLGTRLIDLLTPELPDPNP